MPPNIEVLVPNYNTSDLLISGIIDPLKDHWGVALRLTIVDDGSSPTELHQLTEFLPPNSKLAEHTERLGPARTFNHLLDLASAPYVFLCNSDVIIPRVECLLSLQAQLLAAGNKAIIGTAEGPRFLDSEARPYTLRPPPEHKKLCRQDYTSACAMMFRREELTPTHRFPTNYTNGYYEDTHLCYRLRSAGWRTYYATSHIAHIGNQAMLRLGFESGSPKKRFDFLATIEKNRQHFLGRWSEYLRPRTDIFTDAIANTETVDRLLIEREVQCPTPS
jgi:GT2 family glycosyltransferase